MACHTTSMELLDLRFTAHNVHSDFVQPENLSDYFCLTAPPKSKVWRRQASQDDTSAPMILTRLVHPFILAEVTISAEFEMDWDQGGLVLFAGVAPGHTPSSPVIRRNRRQSNSREIYNPYQNLISTAGGGGKWVKAGLEFTGGELGLSTVVANPHCGPDWSFTPAFPDMTPEEAYAMHMPGLRIKFERVGEDLWIWFRNTDDNSYNTYGSSNIYRSVEFVSQGWKKAREIMSFFCGVDLKTGIWVGCYASRPMELDNETDADGLFVEFEDLEIL